MALFSEAWSRPKDRRVLKSFALGNGDGLFFLFLVSSFRLLLGVFLQRKKRHRPCREGSRSIPKNGTALVAGVHLDWH